MNGTSQTEADDTDERYGVIETGGGEFVIYDRENSTAWLQSDHLVDVGV